MRKFLITLMVTIGLLQISCSTDAVSNASTTNPVDVYVAGSKNGQACYWKNGQIVMLNSGTFAGTYASKIIVSNGNVYVLGLGNILPAAPNVNKSLFWKNGVLTDLSENFNTLARRLTSIEDFDVVGNDVYCVGYTQPALLAVVQGELTVWKNNLPTVLNNSYQYASYSSKIKVLNNNVYVSGPNNNLSTIGYYVNNTFTQIPNASISGLTVNNDQVIVFGGKLITGFYYNIATNTTTTVGFPNDGSIIDMCFDTNNTFYSNGSDVYKNGNLFNSSSSSNINIEFKVLNDNLYKISTNLFALVNDQKVSINNTVTQTASINEYFNSLFVVQN